MKSLPGVWLKVYPPTPTLLEHMRSMLRNVPVLGALLPPPARIHWGVSAVYRVRLTYSCAAYICDDAVLANTIPDPGDRAHIGLLARC